MSQNWICPKCKAYNHPRRQSCWQCGNSYVVATTAKPNRLFAGIYLKILAGLGIISFAICVILLLASFLNSSSNIFRAQTVVTPSPVPTTPPTPTVWPPKFAALETLDSYRLQARLSFGNEATSQSFAILATQEWVKSPLSQHIIISMEDLSGQATPEGMPDLEAMMQMETIVISNTAWFKTGGEWTRMDFQQAQYQSINSLQGLEAYFHALKPAGEEVINDFHCQHYTIDEDTMKASIPNRGNLTMRAQGEIWVVDQSNLPPVIVRMRLQMRMEGSFFPVPIPSVVPSSEATQQEDITYQLEYDVTEINVPIVITPPQ